MTTLLPEQTTHETTWMDQLQGKTIKGVRPEHKRGKPVPEVSLQFSDGSAYQITVRQGVFFEACLVNTLRKAKPIADVVIVTTGADTMLELRANSFPLVQLQAVNKELPEGEFPFELTAKDKTDG